MSMIPAAWYPDPANAAHQGYWDGSASGPSTSLPQRRNSRTGAYVLLLASSTPSYFFPVT